MFSTRSMFFLSVLVVGFVFLISKIWFLQLPGILLVFASLFEPFYADQFRRVAHQADAVNEVVEPTRETEEFKGIPASNSQLWVGEGTAKGRLRALMATITAISELQQAISKHSGSGGDQRSNISMPSIIEVTFIGDKPTKEEMERAKQLIIDEFSGTIIKDTSSPVEPVTTTHEENTKKLRVNTGELKVRLEALALEHKKLESEHSNIQVPKEPSQ